MALSALRQADGKPVRLFVAIEDFQRAVPGA
jgi:hypothetical protein